MTCHICGRQGGLVLPVAIIISLSLLLSGCAALTSPPFPFDFNEFSDRPIPPDVETWLHGGEQTRITPRIAQEAEKITGINRRERLFRGMRHVWKTFSYDSWLNPDMFTRSSDELFTSRKLGDCSDYATVQMTLFRAMGIPCRLVMTANVNWINAFREDGLAITTGHSYLEVFLEDRWYLVDPSFRFFYYDYTPGKKSFPRNQYFYRRGRDFWTLGIRGISDLNRVMRNLALTYPFDFKEPSYPKTDI